MFTLRCTAKLLRRLGVAPESTPPEPTTVLDDWYATLLETRPMRLVLAVSERSLLPVLLPAAPLKTLRERLPVAVCEVLHALGIPPDVADRERAAMNQVCIGKTANRAVLGAMTQIVFELPFDPAFGALDLVQASVNQAGLLRGVWA